MKECPKCSRVYADDALNFCLDDGEWLVGPNAPSDAPTAIISGESGMVEAPTRHQVELTEKTRVDRPTSSAEYIVNEVKRHRVGSIIAAAVIVMVFGAGFLFFRSARFGSSVSTSVPFQSMNITKMTSSGRATSAAISPDGRYVVHVMDENGKQSLWTRQVKIASASQKIIEPQDVFYWGLTFSPDGNYVYFIRSDRSRMTFATLYRMPALGGTPEKLIENVDTNNISFSPDGSRLAFIRRRIPDGETTLLTAKADGTDEHPLATRKYPEDFGGDEPSVAWSPDGKTIACNAGDSTQNNMSVVGVSVADGHVKLLASENWFRVGQLTWFPDGSGLAMLATPGQQFVYQIWHLSIASGKADRISRDLNHYVSLSLTADSNSLVTVQQAISTNIWVAPVADPAHAKQITSGSGTVDGSQGVAWTPDGRIVYETNNGANPDIWIMSSDGSNQKQLTANQRVNIHPTVSPDGRYIAFLSDRNGFPHLWRMNIDGSDPKQITNGSGEEWPSFTPDSQSILFISEAAVGDSTLYKLWRVSVDGGEPVQLTDRWTNRPVASPDGEFIACLSRDDPNSPSKLSIIPATGGEPTKAFAFRAHAYTTPYYRWTPDSRSIVYSDEEITGSNFWLQPIDGGKPTQLSHWDSGLIFSFDLSRDGKQIVAARGTQINDVVLISDSH